MAFAGSARSRARVAMLAGLMAFALACQPTAAPKTSAELAAESLERGVQAQNAGRVNDAIPAYFESLSRDPRSKTAFYNLGQIYRNQQKCAIAEGYYRQSVDIDPRFAPAQFGLGFCRLAAGAWQEAADANRRVIEVEPNNAPAHFNLGLALRQLGDEVGAQAAFQRARQLDASLTPPPAPATPSPSPSPRR